MLHCIGLYDEFMRRVTLILLFLAVALGQDPSLINPRDQDDPKLPDGTSQKQAIIKAEHKQSIEDSQKLMELASEIHADLEKGDANVVSIKMMKQLDEVERLSKKIRARLKRI